MHKKILKTLTIVVFMVAMLLIMSPTLNADAAVIDSGDWGSDDSITWMLDDDGTLTLDGTGVIGSWVDKPDYIEDMLSSVETLVINEGITDIDEYAFWGMDSLKTVYIPGSVHEVRNFFPSDDYGTIGIENFILGEGVEKICEGAFSDKLKSIVIPRSVNEINPWAFDINLSGVTKISGYSGSAAEKFCKDIWNDEIRFREPNGRNLRFWDLEKKTYKIPSPILHGSNSQGSSYNSISLYIGHNHASYFEIYRKSSKSGKYKKICTFKHSIDKNKDCDTYRLNDKSLSFNKKYYYRVRAYFTVNGEKYYSPYSYMTGKTKLPWVAVKSGSTVKNGVRANSLKWDKVRGANGYRIYQYDYKKKKYVCIADRKAGSSRVFIHKNIKKGKTYKYKMRAYRYQNGKKVYGYWSFWIKMKDGKIEREGTIG